MMAKSKHQKTMVITSEAIRHFAATTGDINPLHLDEDYAKKTIFKGRIAHGMLLGSYIASVIGSEFPGFGTIYLSQTLKFIRPVRIGDTIIIKVSVNAVLENNRLLLDTSIENELHELVVTGSAKVIPPLGFIKNKPK